MMNWGGSDCADFVSQAMYKGGIPMDSLHDSSHWWCNMYSSNPPPDYAPWIWITPISQNNYTGLKNYMLQIRGYWEKTDIYHVRVGGIILNSTNTHVMMVTGNDTVGLYLSAHTTDRKNYRFFTKPNSTSSYYANCEYYNVHKYTWVN
jgi:RNA polymerase sigma-70 factor (ECF subfamily)